ncbi:HD domain-containing protein [Senegalia massiliensis]|uniref:HD domain-containing protein n=1 Tax=Senegalia massiliensis TaxID=1720316 RepID=UPI0010308DFD|nr:HD domain-containing protein [Senegalia massiliensis]
MENKLQEEFLKLLDKISGRCNKTELLDFLDKNNYFTAPSSSRYHGAEEEGNLKHSLKVADCALDLNHQMNFGLSQESIIIVALFHDLGKCKYYGQDNYIENILKSGKKSSTKPYTHNPERRGVPHEIASIHMISKFIELSQEEMFAILHHNGMYGDLKYQLQGNETKLQTLIHFADLWSSRFLENGDKDE